MNSRAQLVRKLSHDYWQRLRVGFQNLGDAAGLVDMLDRDVAEEVTKSMCEYLGLEYYPPTDAPPADGKDRAAKARANSPWRKKGGLRLSEKRPDLKP